LLPLLFKDDMKCNKRKLKYAIVGTGALGGYYGGRLAQDGCDVDFLLNSDYAFVSENGLRVDSVKGDFHLFPVQAYGAPADMPKADVVLVCLKTTSNHLLKAILKPLLHDNSVVILIQNGLGIEELLHKDLPETQIAGALAFICSNKIGQGHIRHLDFGKLTLGSHNVLNHDVLQRVCDDFNSAGVPCELTDNLYFARWQKLVWNVPYNGLTVVLNTITDQIMANPNSRELAHQLMYEVVEGANACGVPLKREWADKMIEMTAKMTPYAPSMKLDFDNKRPLEIDAIYSQSIAHALKNGCQMPKVEMLEKQLQFYDKANRLF